MNYLYFAILNHIARYLVNISSVYGTDVIKLYILHATIKHSQSCSNVTTKHSHLNVILRIDWLTSLVRCGSRLKDLAKVLCSLV